MKQIQYTMLIFFVLLFAAGCGSGDTVGDTPQIVVEEIQEPSPAEIAEEAVQAPVEDTVVEQTTEEQVAEDTVEVADMAIEVLGCTDSDGGLNYNVAGTVVDVNGVDDSDYCSQNENYAGKLYEAYCGDDGKHERETYDCLSGSCENGACLE